MLVSDAHRMVFVHVQKTGGVTVSKVLEDLVPDLRQVPERGIQHTTLAQGLQREPGLASYWTFGFVRNPWSRLVSWWAMVQRFKALAEGGHAPAQARFDSNAFLRTSREYADFDTFVAARVARAGAAADPPGDLPARPADRATSADFVGRTEAFQADLRAALEHLGLPFPDELPHTNRSPHAHYTTYYSDASARPGRRAVRRGHRGLRLRVRAAAPLALI